jgi:guanine nucleotide-binding protein subunit alpha
LSEQKGILEEPQTRKVFKKMEDDTVSLMVHRDVDSMMTSCTATSISSSKRSIIFDFDTELFVSRIYQKWIRGSVKRSLRLQQADDTISIVTSKPFDAPRIRGLNIWKSDKSEPHKRSQAIDRDLEDDARRLRRECKVLLLGDESKHELMSLAKIVFGRGYSPEELYAHRPVIFKNVYESAKSVVAAMRRFDIVSESDDIWQSARFIETFNLDPLSSEMDRGFGTALKSIVESVHFTTLMEKRAEFYLPESSE